MRYTLVILCLSFGSGCMAIPDLQEKLKKYMHAKSVLGKKKKSFDILCTIITAIKVLALVCTSDVVNIGLIQPLGRKRVRSSSLN